MVNASVIDEQARIVGYHCPDRYNASRLLFDNLANGRGDYPAVVTEHGITTYAALAGEANRCGNILINRGLSRGDRVIILMDDEPACPAAIMGAMKAGLVPILVNTLSTQELLRYYVVDSGARAAVVSAGFEQILTPALISETTCDTLITSGQDDGPWIGRESLLACSAELEEAETHKDDMAFWMYSSGTTGRPKGVVHRHEDPLYTHFTYARHFLKLGPGDICYSIPKIFFAYGFGNSVTFPFAVGAAALLTTGRPEPAPIFDLIRRCRPTVLFALPTAYTALARFADTRATDLTSVRLCISAAEVLSNDIADAWLKQFDLGIVEGLGSTEVLHIYLSNDSTRRKPGSAGRAVPGYAIRLRDSDGNLVENDGEGVMEVAGLSNTRQYWNQPEKTAETIKGNGEWILTGDRFRRDEDGFYFFLGRADDLVKVSGQWVWPLEIEITLAEHPAVYECAVVAEELPDRRMTVVAYVVPLNGVTADEELSRELQAFVKQTLVPYKYPREIRYRDELPKTGTGKIDRRALRRQKSGVVGS